MNRALECSVAQQQQPLHLHCSTAAQSVLYVDDACMPICAVGLLGLSDCLQLKMVKIEL